MRLLATILTLLFLAGTVSAACKGQDLRASLTKDERQKLAYAVAATPYPEGNHWKATKDGQAIHLIGSIHVDHPKIAPRVASLTPLIESASVVYFEMTFDDQRALEKELRENPELLLLSDTTLPEILDDTAWQLLSAAAEERGFPPFMTAKFRPWYLTMMLAMPPCQDTNLALGGGMDARLQDIAVAADRDIRALEEYDAVFNFFNNAPLNEQADMLLTAIIDPALTQDMYSTLFRQYAEEKHAESWELSRILTARVISDAPERAMAAFDSLEETLLWQRNQAWMTPILKGAQRSSEDAPMVVVSGAAHLHGKQGLLVLLESQGYKIERLPF